MDISAKKFVFIVFSTSLTRVSKFKWFKSFHQLSSFFKISETFKFIFLFLIGNLEKKHNYDCNIFVFSFNIQNNLIFFITV